MFKANFFRQKKRDERRTDEIDPAANSSFEFYETREVSDKFDQLQQW